ncbi:MAG: hypothetical protein MUE81_10250 [Thermoflexibacter sp.]|jgi:hypothetical protein|nr:hypothetical protein [Thermoflexibacter sp.]
MSCKQESAKHNLEDKSIDYQFLARFQNCISSIVMTHLHELDYRSLCSSIVYLEAITGEKSRIVMGGYYPCVYENTHSEDDFSEDLKMWSRWYEVNKSMINMQKAENAIQNYKKANNIEVLIPPPYQEIFDIQERGGTQNCDIDNEFFVNFHNCLLIISLNEIRQMEFLIRLPKNTNAYQCISLLTGIKGIADLDEKKAYFYDFKNSGRDDVVKDLKYWCEWYNNNKCSMNMEKATAILRKHKLQFPDYFTKILVENSN